MNLLIIILLNLIIVSTGELVTNPDFHYQHYAKVVAARTVYVDDVGDYLVLSQAESSVYLLYENDNGDGTIDVYKTKILDAVGQSLNHGLTYRNNWLYVSNSSTIFRVPYTPGQRVNVSVDEMEIVIRNIPASDAANPEAHITRTMLFDGDGFMYIGCGSGSNVDDSEDRSVIRRFDLDNDENEFPIEWSLGELISRGNRNEVGMDFDASGILWGVENGADHVNRSDLGVDIENDNPGEELNKFDKVGTHYGYPYCFSTYSLEGLERGSQLAWDGFVTDGIHSDDWCQDSNNNEPPKFVLPAHTAPLGLEFYKGQNCDSGEGAFPCSMIGDAFIALHGSWNSANPTGYSVVRVPFDKTTLEPAIGEDFINIFYEDPTPFQCLMCFRPVNAVFDLKGHMIVSADATGAIIDRGDIYKVTYGVPPKPIRANIVL